MSSIFLLAEAGEVKKKIHRYWPAASYCCCCCWAIVGAPGAEPADSLRGPHGQSPDQLPTPAAVADREVPSCQRQRLLTESQQPAPAPAPPPTPAPATPWLPPLLPLRPPAPKTQIQIYHLSTSKYKHLLFHPSFPHSPPSRFLTPAHLFSSLLSNPTCCVFPSIIIHLRITPPLPKWLLRYDCSVCASLSPPPPKGPLSFQCPEPA